MGQRPLTIAGNGLGQSSTAARPDADRPSRLRLARLFHCRIGEQLGTHPLRERDVTNSRRSNCPDSGHHFGTPKGVPITEYCDRNKLTPRERLEMFVPVCQAIQHAHQKGIIHRDIKPSNVLVTLYDGQPVPKVIDFGIAKATQQKLTERTMFTGIGQILGTFEYMSPEQAEMNQLDVDTRTDVYSLGVMLYELLTGSTPFTKDQLREVGLEEMLRTIRETEPPKPSTRLSDSGEALTTISSVRKTEPAKLSKLVRGDLDWIVMKALEKDRTRRYETANGLAADIQRFLNDETVKASPPSARYRMGKFVRRNKAPIVTATIIAATLLATGVFAVWQAIHNVKVNEKLARAAFPGTGARKRGFFERPMQQIDYTEFLIASGRAVLHTVFAETYERRVIPYSHERVYSEKIQKELHIKKLVVLPGGHNLMHSFRRETRREILDWLDLHLGPIGP